METLELALNKVSINDMILKQFNATSSPFNEDITLQELFEKQAAKTPDNTAIILNNETLTYSELNNRANALAIHLRRIGVTREKIVGIICERSFEMMVGILSIIKAGGAYMPLSPNDPDIRLKEVINDSHIDTLLVQQKFNSKVAFNGNLVVIEEYSRAQGIVENLPLINKSTDLLYVIYTSGSTGTPKGVMIEHRSLINRLNWMQEAYPVYKDDVILQKTPYNFDVSVWELFWWFTQGATLCFLPAGAEKNPIALASAIEKQQITVMHFVPSLLHVFLDYIHEKGIAEMLNPLRLVFSSGESLSARYVTLFNKVLSNKRLVNLYGPTEATVDVTHYDCTQGEIEGKIAIGKPIHNTQIFIVDQKNNLLAPGKTGELFIGGVGVARGYLNRVDLTAERFVNNPYTGGKMYKSGDMARWYNDGNIDYIGRIDNQVKIRGIRIELGEIEATLSTHPLIKDCIIHTRCYTESITTIVAYYIAPQEITSKELKEFLRRCLPEYMVPSHFIKLAQIPLNANGKADRKALLELVNNS